MRRRTGRLGLDSFARTACTILLTFGATAVSAAEPDRPAAARQTLAAAVASAAATASDDKPKDEKAKDEGQDDAGNKIIEFFKQTEISGLVDGYYEWNFNEEDPIQLRNFDIHHNKFSLNYVEVAFAKTASESSRGGFRMDFGAGDTANLVNAFEPGGTDYLKHVQQAYLSYLAPVGGGLTIDFGKFVTPLGAEVIENKDNFNYSRSLLFALAIPYYHAGFRVGYAFSDKVSLTGFLVNGWNDVVDNNDAKTVGVSLSTKPTDKLGVIANYFVGDEFPEGTDDPGIRNVFDLVVSFAATDKLSVLGNFDYGHDSLGGQGLDWYGVALYAKFQANEKWAFSPRYEWYKDADGFTTGLEQTLQEITLTGEYKAAGGLITRVEYRTDFSDEDYFLEGDTLKSTQPTLSIALIYSFSSK
jgi:Putative beta-barrel porin-2, OmpL-like. bbp2